MSLPGWYPDPAGTPGRFRYWNGSEWSSTTSGDPRDAAPTSGAAGTPPARRPRRGMIIAGAVALVIIIGIIAVGAVINNRSAIVDPAPSTTLPGGGSSAPSLTRPPSSPTPTPVPSPSTAEPSATQQSATRCPVGDPGARQPPVNDSRIHGGGLSFPAQPNYQIGQGGDQLTWAYDVGSQSRAVEPQWFSTFAVGALQTMDGFEEPKGAAELVMACTAPSLYYLGFTGRTDLFSKKITVDGHPGWAIRSQIRVDSDVTTLPGDVVEVIVIDADSPESLSLFWACVPIGDQASLDQLDAVVKRLRVG